MKRQPIENKTILVVEDEKSMLEILVDRFNEEGINVIGAKNGYEGLEQAFKRHPDLILLDIILPKMGGITMLKKLRADNWGKNVPVIIISNLSNNETLAQALEGGAYDYLIKTDWKLEDIVKKVKEKL